MYVSCNGLERINSSWKDQRTTFVEQKKALPYFVLEALLEHLSSKTNHTKRHSSVKKCLGRAVNNTWVKLTILRRPIPRIVTKAPMSKRLTCQGQSKTTTQQKASQSDTTWTFLLSHASTWSFFCQSQYSQQIDAPDEWISSREWHVRLWAKCTRCSQWLHIYNRQPLWEQ